MKTFKVTVEYNGKTGSSTRSISSGIIALQGNESLLEQSSIAARFVLTSLLDQEGIDFGGTLTLDEEVIIK